MRQPSICLLFCFVFILFALSNQSFCRHSECRCTWKNFTISCRRFPEFSTPFKTYHFIHLFVETHCPPMPKVKEFLPNLSTYSCFEVHYFTPRMLPTPISTPKLRGSFSNSGFRWVTNLGFTPSTRSLITMTTVKDREPTAVTHSSVIATVPGLTSNKSSSGQNTTQGVAGPYMDARSKWGLVAIRSGATIAGILVIGCSFILVWIYFQKKKRKKSFWPRPSWFPGCPAWFPGNRLAIEFAASYLHYSPKPSSSTNIHWGVSANWYRSITWEGKWVLGPALIDFWVLFK